MNEINAEINIGGQDAVKKPFIEKYRSHIVWILSIMMMILIIYLIANIELVKVLLNDPVAICRKAGCYCVNTIVQ